jgi:NhaP-type Na+/H+ or K+/H+ antiporter
MVLFTCGIMIGFVLGYGVGLLIDRWDKRIKSDN